MMTDIRLDPRNARIHPEQNKAMIRQSLEEIGAFRSIAVDGDGIIRAGNGVYEQAQALGLKLRVVEAARDELIAVLRPDLRGELAERAAIEHAITDNAAWYCWHASRNQMMVEQVWNKHGAFVHQQIIWKKDRPILTYSWYMWQHEPCFFGWIKGKKPKRTTEDIIPCIWEYPSPAGDDRVEHPTQKPVEVFILPILQHTYPGELCYEPFSGSGTQLVAAETTGRICYANEKSPAFVAVALQRLKDLGLEPRLDK